MIVIFLAFTSVTVVTNTLLIWFAYKGFANVSGKLTDAVREIETSSATKEWIESIRKASDQAVSMTDLTRQRMGEFNPRLDFFQARYEFFLAQVDVRIERMTQGLSENAIRVRDAVSEPAERFAATAAGIQNVLSFIAPRVDPIESEE
jgi:hypothetical protein